MRDINGWVYTDVLVPTRTQVSSRPMQETSYSPSAGKPDNERAHPIGDEDVMCRLA